PPLRRSRADRVAFHSRRRSPPPPLRSARRNAGADVASARRPWGGARGLEPGAKVRTLRWVRGERWLGITRSLIVYWRPGRQRGLRDLYRPFVAPGGLVFDVGAHIGDRTAAFASLGARVVALE